VNQQPAFCSGRFALLRHEVLPEQVLAKNKECPLESPPSTTHPRCRSHWDLLLETKGTELLAWRIESLPETAITGDDPPSIRMGQRIANHRAMYLEYEGPLSKDRGNVWRLAGGTYRGFLCPQSRIDEVFNNPSLKIDFSRERIPPGDLEIIAVCNDQLRRRQPDDDCPSAAEPLDPLALLHAPCFLELVLEAKQARARLILKIPDSEMPTLFGFCLWPSCLLEGKGQ
jgi:hypothetical protein